MKSTPTLLESLVQKRLLISLVVFDKILQSLLLQILGHDQQSQALVPICCRVRQAFLGVPGGEELEEVVLVERSINW